MTLGQWLVSVGLTLLATLVLGVTLRLLVHVARAAAARLRAVAAAAAPLLSVRGLAVLKREQLLRSVQLSVTAVVWLAGLAASYLYLTFALSRFPWTRPWGDALGAFLLSTLASLGLGIVHAVSDLFVVALIFLVTRFANGVLRSLFDAAEQRRIVLPGVHPDTARPTRRIASVLLWVFAVAIAYPHLPGSESATFKGVSALAGLLFALGSAGLVGQAMSGLVLMYSRSFKVGDFITAGGVQGTVIELGLLSTRLRTTKNEYVTLPNGVVVGAAVTNLSMAREHGEALIKASPWRASTARP